MSLLLGSLDATSGNDSGLDPGQVASAFLPKSLFTLISDQKELIPIVFSVFVRSNLFTMEEEERSDGQRVQVGSPVVSMAVPNQQFQDLHDPVTVVVRITVEVRYSVSKKLQISNTNMF